MQERIFKGFWGLKVKVPFWRNWFVVGRLGALVILPACGMGGETVVAIASHPVEPDITYVVTHDGALKTTNGGAGWRRIFTGMSQSRVLTIGIDPTRPSTIYLGTKDDGVYMSYDGGRNWLPRRAGLDDVRVTAEVQNIAFVPGTRPHVFLATAMGVFESDDEGMTWRKRMAGITNVLMVTILAVDPQRPEIMYAGTSGGVYKTTDGARTWVPFNTGLIPPGFVTSSRSLGVTALVIDPQKTEVLYAGTLDGLYKTVDGGRSWTRIGTGLSDQFISSAAFDPLNPEILYVGGRAGVFNSRDGGKTWEPKNEGLASRNILALAASRAAPGVVYAGTNGGGLYRNRQGGPAWERMPLNAQ